MPETEPAQPVYDPAFLHTRREAGLILVAFLVCLCWTVGFSAWAGYEPVPEETRLVMGVPFWVLWGVVVPWLVATVFTVLFALFGIADDDLGEDEAGGAQDA